MNISTPQDWADSLFGQADFVLVKSNRTLFLENFHT